MGILKHSSFILLVWLTISCGDEGNGQMIINGTARYIESNLAAGQLPVELTLYNVPSPFRAGPNNIVSKRKTITDSTGRYEFVFDRSTLPANGAYTLLVTLDSLVIDGNGPGCGSKILGNIFSSENTITRDIQIDSPTFLEIQLIKLDPLNTDRVRVLTTDCVFIESVYENPNTTIFIPLHFHYFKKIDLQYQIFTETYAVTTDKLIPDLVLTRNDTTKVIIEY